jgi:hypothetical protein
LGEFKFILPRRGIGKSLSYIAPQEQFFKSTLIKKKIGANWLFAGYKGSVGA